MRLFFIPLLTLPFLLTPATAQKKPSAIIEQSKAVLATIDGDVKLPGLKESVEVVRDRWGVPHIYAKNQDDLFFAQGFVAAQDRMFQLDLWRRIGVGEMAEVVGESALEADTFARLIRYRGDMDAEWKSYSPDTKQIAIAFTNGINACIKQTGDKLPIEFRILGYQPKLWQPEDILARMAGIVMSRNFSDEVMRAHLIHKLGLEKVRQLMPTDPARDFVPEKGLDLDGIDSKILKSYQAASKSVQFKPMGTESNNWVIAGPLSASGKPMLASDPHRAIAVPALRYVVHLNAPGWNVIGAGEPALPGVALGHNDRIAWGVTIVGTDQADIFVEETNPNDPTQYKVAGAWHPMKVLKEKIRVKGAFHEATVELRYTSHGPVIHQDLKRNRAYALRWAGSDPGGAGYLGGLAVSRAQNKEEFLRALQSWKIPALNFVYADKDENIGWVAAGATPIRPRHDGLLPVPASGGFEWSGYLSVKDYPQSFNPKNDWLATANHNILPKDYKHQIAYEFAPSYRFDRIQQALDTKKKLDLIDFQKLQHDHVSIPGQRLARLLAAVKVDASLEKHAAILRKWDGTLGRNSAAGVIYAAWIPELQEAIYAPHDPTGMVWKDLAAKSGMPNMLRALEAADPVWFGKDAREKRDLVLVRSFEKAVASLNKRFPDPETMRWGGIHTVTFKHPLAGLKKDYPKAFNIGPFERSGDGNTPNNTRYNDKFEQIHGATYRHLFDLADWDKGLATSAPGQSGQPGSPHYDDLAKLWAKEQYFPLAYSRKMVDEVALHKMLLRP